MHESFLPLCLGLTLLVLNVSISSASFECFGDFGAAFPKVGHFNRHCFGYDKNLILTFYEAQAYCEKFGSNLVRVFSYDENDYLQDEFMQDLTSSSHGKFHSFWIGLHYNHTAKRYSWTDGQPLMYSQLNLHDDPNHSEDKCFTLDLYSDYFWNAHDCVNLKMPFVCQLREREMPVKPVKTTITTDDCPASAKQDVPSNSTTVFGDHCYTIETTHRSFLDAKKHCKDKGGYLAKIESKAENVFLQDTLLSDIEFSRGIYWFGLSYSGALDTYQWVDETPVYYTNLYTEWPSVLGKDGCGYISPHNGLWYLLVCENWSSIKNELSSVCEYETTIDSTG